MSSEPKLPDDGEPDAGCWTFSYDASGNCTSQMDSPSPATSFRYDSPDVPEPDVVKQGRLMRLPPEPARVETIEFRLSASERQERRIPLADPAGAVVSVRRVYAYLTRGVAECNAIGSVEVDAAVRDNQVVCTASLGDFGAGDVVVVRVELEVN